MCFLKIGKVAYCTLNGGGLASQYVKVIWYTPAPFKNMLVKYLFVWKNSKILDQQIDQTHLFQMRYNSFPNSKKWPSDSPNGSGTLTFWPSHSVQLFRFLLNHPFSNLDVFGLIQQFFFIFHFAVSKWSKLNNWPTFSSIITGLIHLKPH